MLDGRFGRESGVKWNSQIPFLCVRRVAKVSKGKVKYFLPQAQW